MRTILKLIGLAVAIAVGYWAYETFSTGRNEPGKLAKDAIESAKDAWRIVSGEGAQRGQKLGALAAWGRIAKAIEVLANQGTRVAKVRAPHWLRIMRAFTSVPLNANPGPSQNRGRADKKMKP